MPTKLLQLVIHCGKEVERAWSWSQRPGPNFWLTVNKPQSRSSTDLIFRRALSRLKLGFFSFISKKLGLEVGSRDTLTGSGSSGLNTQKLELGSG